MRAPRRHTAGAVPPSVPVPGVRPYSLADYWLSSMLFGIRGMRRRYLKQAAARVINPLSYPRFMEYDLVRDGLGEFAGKLTLDVGSPKLPALLIARDPEARLVATDVRDYFIDPTAHLLRCGGLAHRLKDGVHLQTADARALPFAGDSFDLLFSISVVEHIPGDGDSQALSEFARVVKPGGRVALTVPFASDGYGEEWVQGDVYERKARGRPVFYQRRYGPSELMSRLVLPSGLRLEKIHYFGEPGWKFEKYWNRVPMKWKLPVLWTQPFLARLLLRRLRPTEARHACGVAILLEKPRDKVATELT